MSATTGWHRHGIERVIWADDACECFGAAASDRRPVMVLDVDVQEPLKEAGRALVAFRERLVRKPE